MGVESVRIEKLNGEWRGIGTDGDGQELWRSPESNSAYAVMEQARVEFPGVAVEIIGQDDGEEQA